MTFEDRTAIPAEDICTLEELCLRSMYFEFQVRFVEQMEGADMGSPLSPVVAPLHYHYNTSFASKHVLASYLYLVLYCFLTVLLTKVHRPKCP